MFDDLRVSGLQPILLKLVSLRQAGDSDGATNAWTETGTIAPFLAIRFHISAGKIDTVVGQMGQSLEYEPSLRDYMSPKAEASLTT